MSFNDKEETMRVIEKTEFEEIIEIKQKFKSKTLATSGAEGQQKESSDKAGSTIATSTESNPSAEQGSKTKQMVRTLYINKIWHDDNIYIVFLEYNQKTKKIEDGWYKIVAVGEKMLNDYEEVKEEKSNSYEWSDENSINNEKDWENDALLELLYLYKGNQPNDEEASNNEQNPELIISILKEMVEWSD